MPNDCYNKLSVTDLKEEDGLQLPDESKVNRNDSGALLLA